MQSIQVRKYQGILKLNFLVRACQKFHQNWTCGSEDMNNLVQLENTNERNVTVLLRTVWLCFENSQKIDD